MYIYPQIEAYHDDLALATNQIEFEQLTAQDRVVILTNLLRFADWKYYVQDDPILADQEYDAFYKQLLQLEKQNPNLVSPDSPSQRIANGISDKFETAQHLVPMLSLSNSYNPDDLQEWDERNIEAKIGDYQYAVEPKYDGASISLIYEDNQLVRGTTRGNGLEGENITINVKQIKSVPLQIEMRAMGMHTIEIRGEVIIPKSNFETINEQRIKEGLAPLANPRNAASGSLRMLDAAEVGKRGLSAVMYHVSYIQMMEGYTVPTEFHSHYGIVGWLKKVGFQTPYDQMISAHTINEVKTACLDFEVKRDELPYEIDGMVVKIDKIAQQDELGMTTHHPRWAMAYKFKARQATSKLIDVEFQVGRTGIVTPVAKITPVPIGGVMVASISLFNEDVIQEKDLKIGDTVLVERAGDVIPYIVKSLAELRTGEETAIHFPKQCPKCEEAVVKFDGEVAWRCVNKNCPAQVVESIIHFASKNAMDIRNMGDANVRKFYELGIVQNVADIYQLPYDRLATLDKLGAKSISNLQTAIEKSKQQPLHRLIFGLGIRFVGETTAKTLARTVEHILDLKNRSLEDLMVLEDVGPKVANSVVDFFAVEENIHLIENLEKLGVNVINQQKNNASNEAEGAFTGKTFLFTGTLSQFKRSDAEQLVEAKGAKLLSGVSSKLNYLVVGADAGSKLEKAKKLGTVIILNETEFQDLLK